MKIIGIALLEPRIAIHKHYMYYIALLLHTVFTPLNAAAFITFELAEGEGAYSRAAFIISAGSYSINFTFVSSHGPWCRRWVLYCGGTRNVRKGIAAAAHQC